MKHACSPLSGVRLRRRHSRKQSGGEAHDLDAALAVGSQQGLIAGLPADGADELGALRGRSWAGKQLCCDGLRQRSVVYVDLHIAACYDACTGCDSCTQSPRVSKQQPSNSSSAALVAQPWWTGRSLGLKHVLTACGANQLRPAESACGQRRGCSAPHWSRSRRR